jgi:hypothetical protein
MTDGQAESLPGSRMTSVLQSLSNVVIALGNDHAQGGQLSQSQGSPTEATPHSLGPP